MTARTQFRDAFNWLAQVGGGVGAELVRITGLVQKNRYQARAVEFDADGRTQFAQTQTIEVTNLAEPADADGQVPSGTDAIALDVEGKWVIYVRPAGTAMFPARVIDSSSGANYTVLEQVITAGGQFEDKTGAAEVTAVNLAELSLGPGAAVDDDTIVLVTTLTDTGSPPSLRYVFDHPSYAKYVD